MKSKLSIRQTLVNELPLVFLQWLISEKILSLYLNRCVTHLETLKKPKERIDLDIFAGALFHFFIWCETTEGFDFWIEYCVKFKRSKSWKQLNKHWKGYCPLVSKKYNKT